MGCSHNYVYTQGHFYCTKCGHRTYGGNYRRKRRQKVWIPLVILVVIGIAFVYWSENNFLVLPLIGFDKIGESTQSEIPPELTHDPTPEPKLVPPPEPKPEPKLVPPPEPKLKTSQSDLLKFAVEQINKDRAERGLLPVLLSNNQAAQIHAEDILKQETISHWLSNGEKPYVTYTKNGGTGYVGQNVATSQCSGFCTGYDLEKEIKDQEYSMMYDDASSNWGHRDNIIDPHHTHVSLGIAHNDNMFVYVQNFEDDYLDGAIQYSNNLVQINGNLREGKVVNIAIFYDPLPTPALYELHKNDAFYEMGNLVAIVERPLPPNSYYDQPSDYNLIVANNWQERGQNISIDFDTSKVFSNSGVYTIGVWIENNGSTFLITSYSILTN